MDIQEPTGLESLPILGRDNRELHVLVSGVQGLLIRSNNPPAPRKEKKVQNMAPAHTSGTFIIGGWGSMLMGGSYGPVEHHETVPG